MVAGLVNLMPRIGRYPIDIAANLINALLITYAILRYQLLDITLVIRKGLVYSSLTALIAGVYLFIVFIFSSAFRTLFYGSLIPAILVASAIAVAFQPMRDRAQLLIDRLFFREKYDSQLMLQELSESATSILDIKRLTSLLLDRLMATMHVKQACIMLKGKENPRFHLVAQKGQTGLEEGVIFREDHPVARWMASYKGALTRHDLDTLPQFKALWSQDREDLDRIEAELFVPLLVREELIGILILGAKLSEVPYSPDEQLTLTTLANQTAVAIQNAWLYQEALQEEERTETILQEVFAGIMVVDPRMRIVTLNPGAEAITGYTSQEVLDKRLPEVFGPELWGEGSPLYKALATGEREAPVEVTLGGKDGARDILLGVAPLHEGYLLSLADITRLKELDRLKSTFLATMSHELRTPLNSIIGFTGIMLQGMAGTLNPEQEKQLNMVYDSAKHLLALINDILDLSKIEAGEVEIVKEEFDVASLINKVVKTVSPLAEQKGLELAVALSPEAGRIYSDRRRVEQILLNLVNNAIKFTERGWVRIEGAIVGKHLQVSVQDTGIGIKREDMGKLFQVFRQVDATITREHEGTGLGLAICKKLVTMLGGEIWAESEYGVESKFSFTLPIEKRKSH